MLHVLQAGPTEEDVDRYTHFETWIEIHAVAQCGYFNASTLGLSFHIPKDAIKCNSMSK